MLDSLCGSVDEAVKSQSWINAAPLLPSVLNPEDVRELLEKAVERSKVDKGQALIFADSVLMSGSMLAKVQESFWPLMDEQARKDVASKKYEKLILNKGQRSISGADPDDYGQESKKDERRKKAAGGKSGGGTQGRETKTKSTKKKYMMTNPKKGGRCPAAAMDSDSDPDQENPDHDQETPSSSGKIEFLSRRDLKLKLSQIGLLQECPDELFHQLALHFYPSLTSTFRDKLNALTLTSASASMQDKRKLHGEVQEKCNNLIAQIRLCQKGLDCFESGSVDRLQLDRHLSKTLCNEAVDALFSYFGEDERSKVIESRGDSGEKAALKAVHSGLGKDVEEWLEIFESEAPKACDIFIRKADKKKDRQVLFNHRQALIQQLEDCDEPALTLHLALLVIFQCQTQHMIHASGKFVPHLMRKLGGSLEAEDVAVLKDYQDSVVKLMSFKEENEESDLIKAKLNEASPAVKKIAFASKKSLKS